jgi:CRP/FNR family transcriptional regulator, cyclic AMP receptor protein
LRTSAFIGKSGKRLLLDALRQQQTLGCAPAVISKIARTARIQKFPRDSQLIIQDSDDNRLAFILRGRVEILIKGEKVAHRLAGQHVGEMSVIDPKARRSATVVATEDTEVAWIEEKDFSKITKSHPELWRALAIEIADRLRQRGSLVRDRNLRPEIFIGSSSESLKIAKAIERSLAPDPVKVKQWNRGVFGASEATIESLEKLLPQTDFAILILTADDKLRTRSKTHPAPRDNVVFELGLFMGAIGRKRTFMLVEKKGRTALRLPPDLHGITTYSYEEQKARSQE